MKSIFTELPHNPVALLLLSGSTFEVGSMQENNPPSDSVCIQTDELAEPVYMSRQECALLIAALQTAVAPQE